MNYFLKDIDKIYNDIVLDYLKKGYTIYIPDLDGTQGERVKIGLTNGRGILVVYIKNNYDLKNDIESKVITIGKVIDYIPYKSQKTIWLNELETIKSLEFYRIRKGNLFTDDKEFCEQCSELHYSRIKNRALQSKKQFTNDKALNIAYRICKCKKGYKSIAKKDIKYVYKFDNNFYININGKSDVKIGKQSKNKIPF